MLSLPGSPLDIRSSKGGWIQIGQRRSPYFRKAFGTEMARAVTEIGFRGALVVLQGYRQPRIVGYRRPDSVLRRALTRYLEQAVFRPVSCISARRAGPEPLLSAKALLYR